MMLRIFDKLMNLTGDEGISAAGQIEAQRYKTWLSSLSYSLFHKLWNEEWDDNQKEYLCHLIDTNMKEIWNKDSAAQRKMEADGEKRWVWSGLCFEAHSECDENVQESEHVDLTYFLFMYFVSDGRTKVCSPALKICFLFE